MPVPAPNTIGAGDTFLSAFIVSVLEGASTREAGERAARFTEDVLRDRITP
jgi:sugar/nucleoside kinase (ribokinase family)